MESIVKRLLEGKSRINESKSLEISVNDLEGNIIGLLKTISDYAERGHSFRVVVDPGDKDYTKEFWIDGDGADRLDIEEVE